MALLAEELVEEWLNRHGFFTIRGVKVSVDEIDLLAIKPASPAPICRHLEVQASVRPMAYIAPRTKEMCLDGRSRRSAKRRTYDEIATAVRAWVAKKYDHPAKRQLMRHLCDADWSRELVLHVAKHEEEVDAIAAAGVQIHRLDTIVEELLAKPPNKYCAGRSDLVDLLVRPAKEADRRA